MIPSIRGANRDGRKHKPIRFILRLYFDDDAKIS